MKFFKGFFLLNKALSHVLVIMVPQGSPAELKTSHYRLLF